MALLDDASKQKGNRRSNVILCHWRWAAYYLLEVVLLGHSCNT